MRTHPRKKSLSALAALTALAATGAASAQSSVTLFGVLDASVSYYSVGSKTNVTVSPLTGLPTAYAFTPAKSQTVLGNGNNASSRIGFRGTEDLGGGLAASFWLEAPLSNDDGSAVRAFTFGRRSTISLSGGFGELRLGRDYTPTFWNDAIFDPYAALGVGINIISQVGGTNRTGRAFLPGDANYARASNSIGYFLPPGLGGFYGQAMYTFHENVQTDAVLANQATVGIGSTRGRYVGGRFGYLNGPLDIAIAYGQSTLGNLGGTLAAPYNTAAFAAAYDAKVKTVNLGASYDFGPVKLMGELSQVKTSFDQPGINGPTGLPLTAAVSDSTKNKGFLVGAVVPVGPGQIKFSYSRVKTTLPGTTSLLPVGGALLPFTTSLPDPTASKIAIGYVHNLSKRTALYATIARISNKNGSALSANTPAIVSATPVSGTPNASSMGYDFGLRHAF